MQYLKQSTAVTLKIGPFLDDSDGKTAETALTIAQADVRLSKNGGNIAQKTEATSCTHDELGIYGCPIDATDTATLGRLQLWVHESGALPVWHEYMVVPANVYDSMFSTDKLEVDLLQMGGVAQSATDLKDFADAGYDPSGHKTQAQMKGLDDGLITAAKIAADAITAMWNKNISAYTGAKAGTYVKTLYDDWLNGGRLDLLIDAIKAQTDDLPSGTPKNTALANFGFLMVLSSDHLTPATGKTLTEQISKDGSAFAACSNNATEIGSGLYKINLTQAEMNADVIILKFSETDCDQRTITILTSS